MFAPWYGITDFNMPPFQYTLFHTFSD